MAYLQLIRQVTWRRARERKFWLSGRSVFPAATILSAESSNGHLTWAVSGRRYCQGSGQHTHGSQLEGIVVSSYAFEHTRRSNVRDLKHEVELNGVARTVSRGRIPYVVLLYKVFQPDTVVIVDLAMVRNGSIRRRMGKPLLEPPRTPSPQSHLA